MTQRAYRIRWKKRSQICKSSRTTRNVVNEYMKTRVAKWSGTRAITATTSWLSWSEQEYRSYISEPERGGRKWKDKQAEQAATYANRRRIRGTRGKRLIRRRGELLERPFAHYLEAGGMRRTHLRRHENILKRLLTHVAGFNLGILMRNLIGKATPKEYAELNASLIAALLRFVSTIGARFAPLQSIGRLNLAVPPNHIFLELAHQTFSVSRIWTFSPGC